MAQSKTELLLQTCVLVGWSGPGHCGWCNRDLGSLKRRWCGAQWVEATGRHAARRIPSECEHLFISNHSWGSARAYAIKRDGGCVRCGVTARLEVNHIIPILGRHGEYSCIHHLSGLETLCHKHHLEVTAQQRQDGHFS